MSLVRIPVQILLILLSVFVSSSTPSQLIKVKKVKLSHYTPWRRFGGEEV
jgi:hypothetical protein